MVRFDILGGLKSALSRGQSIREAMMSFYNAGYAKADVEEAAEILRGQNIQPIVVQKPKVQEQPASEQPKTTQKISAYGQQAQKVLYPFISRAGPAIIQQRPIIQTVSAYTPQQEAEKPPSQAIIILLIILLVILFGLLIAVFFFKNEIISFFSS